MRSRKMQREAYRCDCAGAVPVGRPNPVLGRGVRLTVFEWTGEPQGGCPWAPMRDPFVRRVLETYRWFESGQVATFAPHASHRLIEGVGFYDRALAICRSKLMDLDREEARKNRGNG